MSRMTAQYDVTFWEEPLLSSEAALPRLSQLAKSPQLTVATPHIPAGLPAWRERELLGRLLSAWASERTGAIVRWYYTPMMLPHSRDLASVCTIYDCMDELAKFKFAPPKLQALEDELLDAADLVFTGGASLFESKSGRHDNVHLFASSVDRAHFGRARLPLEEPADQAEIPRPRLGYFGVLDERIDLDLIDRLAERRPAYSLVMIGPVAKIDPEALPRRPNIHYLGAKAYDDLPDYLAGWDGALMPFARNEATRFISPTKTPEYLAGGRPVVSTAITDVVRQYGSLAGVRIASGAESFILACDQALELDGDWLPEADAALVGLSWDRTHEDMSRLMQGVIARRAQTTSTPRPAWSGRPRRPRYDYLVVGAGFAGAVAAERLAAGQDRRVMVIDKRPHVGGNAHDSLNAAGLRIHDYGPHIFHTNSADIFSYLSRFTGWRPYEHRVLADIDGRLAPIPINRTTLNTLYGLDLATDEAAASFLARAAQPCERVRTAEDAVVSQVGRDLYETFFRGYTRKQWGLDPSQLDKAVTARIPTRCNDDDRYFTDAFQFMPAEGYTRLFERMLDHPLIEVATSVDFRTAHAEIDFDQLIYTGRVDEYFGRRFGELPYRSLRFEHQTLDREWFQPVGTVNYPAEWVPYTRVTEFKHLTGQQHRSTSIVHEFPQAEGDPYYPVPREENQALYRRYQTLAARTPDVHFVGRLATYRYYNMDQVVGQSLALCRRLASSEREVVQVGRIAEPAMAT